MSIGENIRRYREQRRMTQEELAIAAGYKSRSSIGKIENGDSDPTQKNLVRIARALNVKAVDLLGTPAQVYTATADQLRAADALTDEERMLVKAYREARGSYQALAMELLMEHKKED